MGSRPLQIFSTMMVGAPIIWETHTSASSGTSSDRDELDLAVFANRLDGHQLADVGVTRRRAENGRAERHILDFLNTDHSSHGKRFSLLNLEGCFLSLESF